MNLTTLEQEQIKLAKKITIKDHFGEIRTIAGCDIAYTGKHMVTVIAVMDFKTMRLREYKYLVGTPGFPYISGFLGYREALPIIETYHKLELDPDMMLIDGNGILHPRKFGLACAVGLSLDKPTIGVAKSILCGEEIDNKIVLDGENIGLVMPSRDKVKPIYISPGFKVSFDSSKSLVQKSVQDHKLPEPLHQAHRIANKLRRKIKDGVRPVLE